ncbi:MULTISPECIES: efflux RND transporter periplasmic adaptor subunit [Psychrilyobacter]|nr:MULTISPECIES: HlyD family efflux transporter periplasmic adaptor subunit [Psychrilyobacter]MCS5420933.1 HlyD family efflux transporter periplasmic adaptor subunit [Psychrilyobacter sp. S5]NDI77660.1 HlyD family efflux transporter periplasmic adaptor subunit [Psychrilyobacter piezotolerans]
MKTNKIILLALIIAIGGIFMMKNEDVDDGSRAIKAVKISTVKTGDLNESLFFEGVVTPRESIPIYLNFPVIVDKILVREGTEVEKGEELIIFSPSTKINFERELQMAELDIKNIELQLADLNSGSIKLELESRKLEIKTLNEDIKALNRQLSIIIFEAKNSRKEANAKMKLLDNDAISSTDVNMAITAANRNEMEVVDTKTALELSKQKYELMISSYERLKRELNLQKLRIEGEYQKQKLKKQDIEEKLEKVGKPLTAPINGIITELLVEKGTHAGAGIKLLSIAAIGDNMVKLNIPVQQAKWIRKGQNSKIIVREGFEEQVVSGRVESVARVAKTIGGADYTERIIEVEISSNNKNLKLGYSVGVEIEGENRINLKLIDAFSIFQEDEKNYVYTVEDNRVKKTLVEIGAKTVSKFEVLNLAEGTQIVVNPFKVKDGDRIKIRK